jgi:hypothetical protein
MGECCINCFNNDHIINFILENGNIGKCDYCESEEIETVETEIIGNYIREKLKLAYENVENSGIYWDSELKEYIEGEDIFEILAFNEGIFSEKIVDKDNQRKLTDDFMTDSGPNWHDISQGADDYFDDGAALLVLKNKYFGVESNKFIFNWDRFKYQCKHYGRYFDFGFEVETRESLLGTLSKILSHEKLKSKLKKRKQIWRARVLSEDDKFSFNESPNKMQKEIGPPPNQNVKNNRMSPAGISYTYVSENPETCIIEVRPNYGSEMLVGKFEIIKNLKLLDLTFIPNYRVKSIFNPEYDHDMRWATNFLEQFIDDITKPCMKDDAILDYIPTQLLAEYIRKEGYDGIKFYSSLNYNINYTLFFGPELEEDWRLKYYDTIKPFTKIMQLRELYNFRLNDIRFNKNKYSNKEYKNEDFEIKKEDEIDDFFNGSVDF